jgi:hypothetical protein
MKGRHRRIHTNPSSGSGGGRGARNANASNVGNSVTTQQHISTTIHTAQGPATIQLIPVQMAATQFRGTPITTAQWTAQQQQQQQQQQNNSNNSAGNASNSANTSSPSTPSTPTTTT